jgi:hypothetical protein
MSDADNDRDCNDITDILQNQQTVEDDKLRKGIFELFQRGEELHDRMQRVIKRTSDPSQAASATSALHDISEEHQLTAEHLGKLLLRWQFRGYGLELPSGETDQSSEPSLDTEPSSDKPPPTKKRPDKPPKEKASPPTTSSIGGPDIERGVRHASQLIDNLGSPPDSFEGITDVTEEFQTIQDAFNPEEWSHYPQDLKTMMMSYLAARARWLQEEASTQDLEMAGVDEHLEGFFPSLTKFMKRHEPGYAYGLAKHHVPQETPSWYGDAEYWRDEIEDHLGVPDGGEDLNPERALARLKDFIETSPDPDDVAGYVTSLVKSGLDPSDPRLLKMVGGIYDPEVFGSSELKEFRRAYRDFYTEDSDQTKDRAMTDWTLYPKMSDLDVALVGCDISSERRHAIQEALGFRTMTTINPNKIRRVQSATDKVYNGSYDLIVVLTDRTSTHAVDDTLLDAAKSMEGVSVVQVPTGHNASQIRRSIDDQFPQDVNA